MIGGHTGFLRVSWRRRSSSSCPPLRHRTPGGHSHRSASKLNRSPPSHRIALHRRIPRPVKQDIIRGFGASLEERDGHSDRIGCRSQHRRLAVRQHLLAAAGRPLRPGQAGHGAGAAGVDPEPPAGGRTRPRPRRDVAGSRRGPVRGPGPAGRLPADRPGVRRAPVRRLHHARRRPRHPAGRAPDAVRPARRHPVEGGGADAVLARRRRPRRPRADAPRVRHQRGHGRPRHPHHAEPRGRHHRRTGLPGVGRSRGRS